MRLRGLLLLLPLSLAATGQWEIKTDLFPEQIIDPETAAEDKMLRVENFYIGEINADNFGISNPCCQLVSKTEYYNQYGRITLRVSRQADRDSIRWYEQFIYNERRQLTEILGPSSDTTNVQIRTTYSYDDAGRVNYIRHFLKDKDSTLWVRHISYTADERQMTVKYYYATSTMPYTFCFHYNKKGELFCKQQFTGDTLNPVEVDSVYYLKNLRYHYWLGYQKIGRVDGSYYVERRLKSLVIDSLDSRGEILSHRYFQFNEANEPLKWGEWINLYTEAGVLYKTLVSHGNIDVYYDRKGNHAMSLQLNLDKNVYELWGSTYVYADDPELE